MVHCGAEGTADRKLNQMVTFTTAVGWQRETDAGTQLAFTFYSDENPSL